MRKTSILHIIDSLTVGGAEKLLVSTINGLPEFEHHLIYLSGSDALLPQLTAPCRVFKLGVVTKIGFFRSAFFLRRYIRKHKISIVHSHLCLATVIARMGCPSDVKLFSTIHNLPSKSYFKASKLLKWMEKITYRRRHHIIAICKEVYNDYDRCIGIKGPYTILYNFIEDKFFKQNFKYPGHNCKLNLVAVGNLKYQKNYPYLVEVFKKLPEHIRLDVYGSGDLAYKLQEDIDRYNLNIRLCGVRHDMEKILPEYDALVMSSHYEGQPLAVLEAMASGVPVILSDIPVLHEVTDSKAVFFDIKDPSDLKRKLIAISDHKIDLEPVATANHERAQQIARKENYLKNLKEVYFRAANELSQEVLKVVKQKFVLAKSRNFILLTSVFSSIFLASC